MSACDNITAAERERCARIVEACSDVVDEGLDRVVRIVAKSAPELLPLATQPIVRQFVAGVCRAFLVAVAEEIRRG